MFSILMDILSIAAILFMAFVTSHQTLIMMLWILILLVWVFKLIKHLLKYEKDKKKDI